MTFHKIKGRLLQADMSTNTRLFLYVYYAGHGVMFDNSPTTQVVLNEADESKRYARLEFNLYNMASCLKNIFIIVVFDCCRERQSKEPIRRRGADAQEEEP